MYYIDESDAGLTHRHLDLKGALFVTLGLISLVYAFTKAPTYGWTDHKTLEFFRSKLSPSNSFL